MVKVHTIISCSNPYSFLIVEICHKCGCRKHSSRNKVTPGHQVTQQGQRSNRGYSNTLHLHPQSISQGCIHFLLVSWIEPEQNFKVMVTTVMSKFKSRSIHIEMPTTKILSKLMVTIIRSNQDHTMTLHTYIHSTMSLPRINFLYFMVFEYSPDKIL